MNNKGISLIEVVVAMTIIAIISTSAITTYNSFRKADADNIIKKIGYSLDEARTYSEIKGGQISVTIYETSDKKYMIDIKSFLEKLQSLNLIRGKILCNI